MRARPATAAERKAYDPEEGTSGLKRSKRRVRVLSTSSSDAEIELHADGANLFPEHTDEDGHARRALRALEEGEPPGSARSPPGSGPLESIPLPPAGKNKGKRPLPKEEHGLPGVMAAFNRGYKRMGLLHDVRDLLRRKPELVERYGRGLAFWSSVSTVKLNTEQVRAIPWIGCVGKTDDSSLPFWMRSLPPLSGCHVCGHSHPMRACPLAARLEEEFGGGPLLWEEELCQYRYCIRTILPIRIKAVEGLGVVLVALVHSSGS